MGVCIICFYQYLFVLVWVSVRSTVFSSQAMRLTATQSKIQAYLNAQTNLTDELLVGYDKRFIPTIPGAHKLNT
ncbi:Hypothetical predicted protein [Paramuricea clavata]|uniref:Uncharacterized protein n=1 Tax=Paramuricea clavata TaxID=317549 RepID=A0A6S7J0W5_PARCT|nr:Hypothetical predicted protein [Paramuricea clavata]